ncbi:hypothetical protein C2I18_03720 [Paenibacillus sp. PK3_47]|uniref:C39 family peptidase n=1 Tax=Paenibacillus sp. PK3_47 TaxID=2072642 RepID=UPI00201E486A|nr:C39 family peptidase [Paenibacillus sp. PK3_47]UQZ32742.1 hypothetical protein C2I18_03720 [Paenibacillus sp. PK3_47]
MSLESFFTLLVEAYESWGSEIDISDVNPKYEASDAVKKMTLIGVHDNQFEVVGARDSDLDYGSVAYWLMKLHDSIQKRFYSRSDPTATTGDLLRRINTATALHTWTRTSNQTGTYASGDLLEGEAGTDQLLTRLMAAEMLVSAYEAILGEIQTVPASKPRDTEDIHAWKASDLFFWSESGDFEPEKTGRWDDWSFMPAIVYDAALRADLKLQEAKAPYGSVVAALATLMKSYEGSEQNVIEDTIVLNERPYEWHVYQQDTGEYSQVNCMPATVEMALRYQGLSDIPSAETLRRDNPWNGVGWTDVVAENVMLQYGLKFTDSFDTTVDLDKMLDHLDKGNILYVMFREADNTEGHSSLIKGYRKSGNQVQFIVSDPNYNIMGPFGYFEYLKDAETLLSDMERHLPRYFIIPPGE